MFPTILQARLEEVFDQVKVNPLVHEHWFDALGEFASSIRIRRGLADVVTVEEETWDITDSGDLIITATVEGEILQMLVPKGTWEWL